MAHIFDKAEKVSGVALGILQRLIVLPGLFTNRYGITDFKGAKGDVVNVKRPAILKARDAGFRARNSIVMDDLVQSRIQVKLDRYPYSGVQLSDEELTLDVENFSQDVTVPQARALAEDFENTIAGVLSGADYVHELVFNPNASDGTEDPRKVAIQARKMLNDSNVPASGRYWLVGSEVSAAISSFEKLLDVNTAGLPEAVREGVVGKLSGFTIVESNALAGDESYFVHNSAVAMAVVAPAAPKGATSSGVAVEGGLAVRQLFDYDSDTLADRSILSVFTGGSPVTDPEIRDGEIVIVDGEVQMEFIRAVKVTLGTDAGKASWALAYTAVTAGEFTIEVDGEETAAIAFDATNAEIAAAINDIQGVAGAKVKGTATAKTVTFTELVELAVDSTSLTGTIAAS